jgi:hypothetical protein
MVIRVPARCHNILPSMRPIDDARSDGPAVRYMLPPTTCHTVQPAIAGESDCVPYA